MLTQFMRYDAGRGMLIGERQRSACISCRQSAVCGSRLLERTDRERAELPGCLVAESPAVEHGQEFAVQLPAASFVIHCLAIFPGISLLMLLGASLGGILVPAWPEAASAFGALAGLVVGALLLRLYDSASGCRSLLNRLVVVPSGRVSEDDS